MFSLAVTRWLVPGPLELPSGDLDHTSAPSASVARPLASSHSSMGDNMQVLRTPADRFANLPGFGFESHYLEVPAVQVPGDGDGSPATLRIHYVDEGPRDGQIVLLMHGEPSWSYLYRTMIPVLTAAGYRCVAPDLVGFGKSDKPSEQTDYTFARHVEWMRSALFDELELSDVTLVAQDWGSLIGLRLVGENPERFARVVIANGGLPTGDQVMSDAFLAWQKFASETDTFPVGALVNGGSATELPADVIAAYDAPFPDDRHLAGARVFPSLVPTSPEDPATEANRAAWETLMEFQRPFLTAFSDKDPITKGGAAAFIDRVPGTRGQNHTTIEGGGHFLQEDRGPEFAQVVVEFIAAN